MNWLGSCTHFLQKSQNLTIYYGIYVSAKLRLTKCEIYKRRSGLAGGLTKNDIRKNQKNEQSKK